MVFSIGIDGIVFAQMNQAAQRDPPLPGSGEEFLQAKTYVVAFKGTGGLAKGKVALYFFRKAIEVATERDFPVSAAGRDCRNSGGDGGLFERFLVTGQRFQLLVLFGSYIGGSGLFQGLGIGRDGDILPGDCYGFDDHHFAGIGGDLDWGWRF